MANHTTPYPQTTFDVEVTHNGIAWFVVSSAHFRFKDADSEMKRRNKLKLRDPLKHQDIRIVRVTKEVVV